jgi:type IV fimbrial biogenesis protein FimT
MRSRGFTIIEFAVTLAIVGILVSIALPNLMSMVANSQLRSVSSELHAALSTARAEALRSRTAVTFCAVNAGACDTSWNQGWALFVDVNNDGTINSGEKIIAEYGKLPTGLSISGTSKFRFFSSGTSDTVATLQIRKTGATSGRDLQIGTNGRPISKKVAP